MLTFSRRCAVRVQPDGRAAQDRLPVLPRPRQARRLPARPLLLPGQLRVLRAGAGAPYRVRLLRQRGAGAAVVAARLPGEPVGRADGDGVPVLRRRRAVRGRAWLGPRATLPPLDSQPGRRLDRVARLLALPSQ